MTIYDANGRDVTDAHYAKARISEGARASSEWARQTLNAKPSGNLGRDLRAEGNQIGAAISDPLAIREALKYD